MENPIFNRYIFDKFNCYAEDEADSQGNIPQGMTRAGVILRILFLTLVGLVAGSLAFTAHLVASTSALIGLLIISILLIAVLRYFPQYAFLSATVYSGVQGATVGGMLYLSQGSELNGLVMRISLVSLSAMILTLLMYVSDFVKRSNRWSVTILGTIGSMIAMYVGVFLCANLGWCEFTMELDFIDVIYALIGLTTTFTLAATLEDIQHGINMKVSKFLEWYSSFAVIFAFIYAYINILNICIYCLREEGLLGIAEDIVDD